MAAPTISADRLVARLDALAAIGPTTGGDGARGNARLALTDADRAGRDLVVTWMRDLQLDVTIDEVGNVVGRTPWGDGDPVMTGSHIDTVATGGRFDGNLGVLAGLEVIEACLIAGHLTARPLAVAFFTNEEGARFQPDMLGSLVYVGGLAVESALDTTASDGARLGDELDRIGYAGGSPCPALPPQAFVELHVEQGPVLEDEGLTIGAVTGVQGISWQEVTVIGQSNHAGTTPMRLRHDAGYVAAELAAFVRRLTNEFGPPQVGTVGSIELRPNLINVVAASAKLTVDLRNTDEATLQVAEQRFAAYCDLLAASEGVAIERRTLARFEPVAFDESVVARIEAAAIRRGLAVGRLPSGAGHDAQMLARVCPTAMIFVPSIRGISHNPAELTDPADLLAGTEVLLDVLLELAGSR
jgi:N-carbamoyl-L-amino-acid hydrolase